jgi:hypothetical protein
MAYYVDSIFNYKNEITFFYFYESYVEHFTLFPRRPMYKGICYVIGKTRIFSCVCVNHYKTHIYIRVCWNQYFARDLGYKSSVAVGSGHGFPFRTLSRPRGVNVLLHASEPMFYSFRRRDLNFELRLVAAAHKNHLNKTLGASCYISNFQMAVVATTVFDEFNIIIEKMNTKFVSI